MKQKQKVKKFRTVNARVFAALLWDNITWTGGAGSGAERKKINARAKELHFKREGKSNQTVSFITLIFHKYWTVFD